MLPSTTTPLSSYTKNFDFLDKKLELTSHLYLRYTEINLCTSNSYKYIWFVVAGLVYFTPYCRSVYIASFPGPEREETVLLHTICACA